MECDNTTEKRATSLLDELLSISLLRNLSNKEAIDILQGALALLVLDNLPENVGYQLRLLTEYVDSDDEDDIEQEGRPTKRPTLNREQTTSLHQSPK